MRSSGAPPESVIASLTPLQGLPIFHFPTHDSRRGLHSFAASRLEASAPFTFPARDRAMTRTPPGRALISHFPRRWKCRANIRRPAGAEICGISIRRHDGDGSLGMDGQKRGSSCLSLDNVDLQQRFDIQVREISSEIISEQLHVVRAGGKLSGSLGSVST